MRFRQVHLDFHTNATIPGIGTHFDAKAFGKAFKDAYVDSVTIFSKCHHGVSYHPTKVGKMHPHLDFDLTRAQLDALHANGINAPIYLCAAWDELAAHQHPEWRIVSPDNTLPMFKPEWGNGVGWAYLDFSTPYLDYLVAQTDEAMRLFPDADGIFMDISMQPSSISVSMRDKMDAAGLDWTNPKDRDDFSAQVVENYFVRIRDTVRKHNAKMPLYFNSAFRRGMRKIYSNYYTHLELESLPTGGWGYEHFPLTARYVDPLGIPFLGMTGKFHTHWGEVGGYKQPEALVYEVGAMLAQGARCSIGDHLHPTGKIDQSTMDIIRPAYKWVADREPWAVDTTNRAEIALLSYQSATNPRLVGLPRDFDEIDQGAVRLLLEAKFTFDVIDPESDFSAYKVLILPDAIPVGKALQAKIDKYAKKGGKVILTGRSGIDPETGFVFDVGAEWKGTSPNGGGDYVLPVKGLRATHVNDPLFMEGVASERIKIKGGKSLGQVYEPYFDRTPRHFSGHVNAASKPDPSGYAAGVEKANFIYFAFPLFETYFRIGAVPMLEIGERLVQHALGTKPLVTTSLPRAGRVTVRSQKGKKRDIVHLLHATPALRGSHRGGPVQPIQDLVTIHDIAVDLLPTGKVKSVKLVPSGKPLSFAEREGRVSFTVPTLTGHEMVEVAY